jgi:two-component system, OmpR family, heavy metal sensor histidine kinase CusS
LSLVVDNLLFLARAESARERIAYTEFDGREAIEKIATFYGTIAEERNVRVHCEGTGTITADRILFERAISNLVENALRFTPDGGAVGILLTKRNNHVEVSVSDTGCGIAPEHVPRVFDRFYRVDPSRSAEGTGLGLALVKSIAELHGGSVSLTSTVNRGTTVVLVFPSARRVA